MSSTREFEVADETAIRSKQNKAPSINKHCFVFYPLVVTAVLYLLVYEFAIASEIC